MRPSELAAKAKNDSQLSVGTHAAWEGELPSDAPAQNMVEEPMQLHRRHHGRGKDFGANLSTHLQIAA